MNAAQRLLTIRYRRERLAILQERLARLEGLSSQGALSVGSLEECRLEVLEAEYLLGMAEAEEK